MKSTLVFVLLLMYAGCSCNALEVFLNKPKTVVYQKNKYESVVYDSRPELCANLSLQELDSIENYSNANIRILQITVTPLQLTQIMASESDIKSFSTKLEAIKKAGYYVSLVVDLNEISGDQISSIKQKIPELIKSLRNEEITVVSFGYKLITGDSAVVNAQNDLLKETKCLINTYMAPLTMTIEIDSKSIDLLKKIYELGNRESFDILVLTNNKAAENLTNESLVIKKIMFDNKDENKPMWLNGLEQGEVESFIDKNSISGLFKRVFLSDNVDIDQKLTDLAEEKGINKAFNASTNKYDLFFDTDCIPVGYTYKLDGGGVRVFGIGVNSLLPTRISFYRQSDVQRKVEEKTNKSTRPIPDPFDH